MSNLPYSEGTWFAVPLTDAGYGIGVVARMARRGGNVFGYFFGPRRSRVPTLRDLPNYEPKDGVLVCQFSDLNLVEGAWPIIGEQESWRRADWPMPAFGWHDTSAGVYRAVRHAEDNPGNPISWTIVSREEYEALPRDHSYSQGAVEIVLTKRLGGAWPAPPR